MNSINHKPHSAAPLEPSLQATGEHEQYISVADAAKLVGLNPAVLRGKLRSGEIPGLVVLGPRFHRVSKPVMTAFLHGKASEGKAA